MKKMYKLFLGLVAIVAMFTFISCEGPAGPAGAAGADGADGIDGTDGKDGVDGNVTCLVCHTQANMDAIASEYALSDHSNPGFELGYAGPRAGCMQCHSNEGFIAHANGYDPAENLDFASKITCGTCHGSHESLEDGISAPMYTDDAVISMADGESVFDFGNSSNTCANCHQSRKIGEYYSSVDTVWTDDINGNDSIDFIVHPDSVYISSSHANPHYTTMTNNIFGTGGYTTGTIDPTPHKGVGCVGCHMEGGHSMMPTVASCTKCHADATDFDINGVQTETNAALDVIAAELVALGILDTDHKTQLVIVSNAQFEAYWNYKIVLYDASEGVHNPDYISALLDDAKTKLGI